MLFAFGTLRLTDGLQHRLPVPAMYRMLASSARSALGTISEIGLPAGLAHAAQLLTSAHHQEHPCSNSKERSCSGTASSVQQQVSTAPSWPAGLSSPPQVSSCSPQACGATSIPSVPHVWQLTAQYSSAAPDGNARKQSTSSRTYGWNHWRAAACAPDVKWLTCQIQACSSVQQLHDLTTAHSQHMDHIHINAAIGCLVTLCGQQATQHQDQQQQQQQQQAGQVMMMLWGVLQHQLLSCTPRSLGNIIYSLFCKAPAAIKQQYQPAVMQQLFPAFMQQLQFADPQAVSNVLYAAAVSEQQLSAQQVLQLVKRLVDTARRAAPQDISNTLWAVATMQCTIPQLHVDDLVNALTAKVQLAKPQDVSMSLWAVAAMNQRLQEHHLQQLLQALSNKLEVAQPQSLSMAIWACGHFGHMPKQLLSDPRVKAMLQTADPQALGNIAWACGSLGYRNERLMGQILQLMQQRFKEQCKPHDHTTQHFTIVLAWVIAVLNLQQHSRQVIELLMPLSLHWDELPEQNLQQLYQVHCWLQDTGYGRGQGLSDVLTAKQLQQCQAACSRRQFTLQAVAAGPTSLQKQVFAVARSLPINWQQPLQMEQGTADGLLLIDIAGKTASGQLVAVEVDGPTHFVAPDNSLNGPTQYRNRALTARGYTVVSVPFFEWVEPKGGSEQKQCLLELFIAAGLT